MQIPSGLIIHSTELFIIYVDCRKLKGKEIRKNAGSVTRETAAQIF
jgi:hypothetical protein